MNKLALGLILALIPAAAFAEPQVSLTSHVALARTVLDNAGKPVTSYEEPKLVTPGDRLLFTLDYSNSSGKAADNFVVTDPIPSGVVFAGNQSAGAEMSVDGGKTFAALGALKVADAAGKERPATDADVTHVRWTFQRAIPAGEHGELRFEAVVK
jgi:uncharacterized repeat protein (TIGR01451 family)